MSKYNIDEEPNNNLNENIEFDENLFNDTQINDDELGSIDEADKYYEDIKGEEESSEVDDKFMTGEDNIEPEEASKSKDKKKSKEKEPFDLKREILSWVKMIVAAVIIAFVINNFIIVNATVPTGSMEDTIATGSRIMGFRLSYLFGDPDRGDIIIFEFPYRDENYIKRIIGLPGETVYIDNAIITIEKPDGTTEVLEEDYLKEKWVYKTGPYKFVVPEDCYFVLGDNRNASLDTRSWLENYGDDERLYIKRDKILGKAIFTYWKSFEILD